MKHYNKLLVWGFISALFFPLSNAFAQDFIPLSSSSVVSATADTSVMESQPTDNLNYTHAVTAGNEPQTGHAYQTFGLVKFNLPQLSNIAVITQAKLRQTIRESYGTGALNRRVYAAQATGRNWTETQVNWQTRPYYNGISQYGTRSSSSEEWDVTNIVKSWYEQPSSYPNYGFVMIPETSSTFYNISYKTRESGAAAQLIIDYEFRYPSPTPTPRIINPNIALNNGSDLLDPIRVIVPNIASPSPTSAPNPQARPEIFNLSYVASGENVTFTWQTTIPATTQVWYSLDDRYDHYSVFNSNLTTNHVATLTSVTPATYHYMAVSRDNFYHYTYSPRSTFTVSSAALPASNESPMDEIVTTPGVAASPEAPFAAGQDGEQINQGSETNSPEPNAATDAGGSYDNQVTTSDVQVESQTPDSFFGKLKSLVEDELAQILVNARSKSAEEGKTGISSLNPLVLLSGAYGTNRTVGIALIGFSILLFLVTYLITHLGKKSLHHIKKKLDNNKEKSAADTEKKEK